MEIAKYRRDSLHGKHIQSCSLHVHGNTLVTPNRLAQPCCEGAL